MIADDSYIDGFAACVIRDAINSATAACWDRRADEFEKALPCAGDYTGRSTAAERAQREARLRSKITACRNQAILWRHVANGIPLLDLVAVDAERQAAA